MSIVDKTVCVVGLGYIGLPTAAILASRGVRVRGVDTKQPVVSSVVAGRAPFVEPDLGACISRVVKAGTLTASGVIGPADFYIVAVPTPVSDTHEPDLTYIRSAAKAIATVVKPGNVVILESTSPPGTTEKLAEWILGERPDLQNGTDGPKVLFAHCPERVLPGRIMSELVSNDRVVGGLTPEAADRAAELYRVFCEGEVLTTDARTAELVKLAENTYRDVNIAYANELSLVCADLGIDVWELIRLANRHPRVDILKPGPGVGGHCIAVDPWFIVAADPENSRLIATSREVNDAKPSRVIADIRATIDGISQPIVAALGLAFKADVDDLRESPARDIVFRLATENPDLTVNVVEPHIDTLPDELASLSNVHLVPYDVALDSADSVALLVDHRVFVEQPTLKPGVAVVDTRGCWPTAEAGQRFYLPV